MEVMNYDAWKKRFILVLRMLTAEDLILNSLDFLGIPYIEYDTTTDYDLDRQWKTDINKVCGIIISGSRTAINFNFMPSFPIDIINTGIPVLGICYGNEFLSGHLGSEIVACNQPLGEHGTVIAKLSKNELFNGLNVENPTLVTMNHDMMMADIPKNTTLIASTELTKHAGFYHEEKRWWGIQFHPEKDWLGAIIFKNFYEICRK
jgi:GMP synthase (glutamine-hydrolysing)